MCCVIQNSASDCVGQRGRGQQLVRVPASSSLRGGGLSPVPRPETSPATESPRKAATAPYSEKGAPQQPTNCTVMFFPLCSTTNPTLSSNGVNNYFKSFLLLAARPAYKPHFFSQE